MPEQLQIAVEARKDTGKGSNRRLRAQGLVPGIFYDGKGENIPVQVANIPLEKLFSKVKSSMVFDLVINDGGKTVTKPVLIKELRHHPIKPFIEHVDFYGLDLTHEIRLYVPVEVQGEPKGKEAGGIFNLYRDTLEVSCMPSAIPESIKIDISHLGMNDAIHIEEIQFPEGVTPIFEENFTIAGVTPSTLDKEEAAEEAAEEEAATAAAVEEGTAEEE
ncbi:MAG: 50S ribosomal protein L25 [Desulfovibrionales bacterium]